MKGRFDQVAFYTARKVTQVYSTSFSLGIKMFNRKYRAPIYAIYGFVRYADEIVDTFHACDKKLLLQKFREDTYLALDQKISMNPLLHAFQQTVNGYGISRELIDSFLHSMEMDLDLKEYDRSGFEEYVLGSAEVVGLMCLKVFLDGNEEEYNYLTPYAMRLGSAYQKINFLRDMKADFEKLGRSYFPGVDLTNLDDAQKRRIEAEIEEDFRMGEKGIRRLPKPVRLGVYLSFVYYYALFNKIRKLPLEVILKERVRIHNGRKYLLMSRAFLQFKFGMV